jgi:hypothetical protein
MPFFLLNHISTYSILVAAIIGLVRYKRIHRFYRPFLFFIWLGTFSELLSMWLAYTSGNSMPAGNIYVLAEYPLLLYIFYRWTKDDSPFRYRLLLSAGLVIWIIDNLWWHTLFTVNSVYRVFYSVIILYESVRMLNGLLLSEKKRLLTNPVFQVCMAFLLYYSFKAFIEIFYIAQLSFSDGFYMSLFQVLLCVNLLTNLIYAIAVLCFPTKQEFSLRY